MDTRNALKLQASIIADLALRTADQYDTLARKGLTVLIENAYWKDGLTLPELPGGWMAKYVGTTETDGRGKIVLLPNHTHSRRVWLEGQINIAKNAGLSEEHAKTWAISKVNHKHDLLPLLAKVMVNDALMQHYLSWNIRFSVDEFHKWSARSGIVDHLNPLRRRSLQRLIKELQNPQQRPDKKDRGDAAEDCPMPRSPAMEALEAEALLVESETLVVNIGEAEIPVTAAELADVHTPVIGDVGAA